MTILLIETVSSGGDLGSRLAGAGDRGSVLDLKEPAQAGGIMEIRRQSPTEARLASARIPRRGLLDEVE
jgi:hypothetical protein